MRKIDSWYKADEGKHFVLTEIGKTWASYKDREVGQPIDSDDTYATASMIESGALIEVDDPEWVEMPGFRAVYDCKGDGKYIFDCGNPYVYPEKEMAEAAATEFNNRPWNKDTKAFVIEATYKGKRPTPCKEYEGQRVFNRDYWTYARPVGSLVEQEIVNDAMNALPPACMRSDCSQLGEPADVRIDENGKARNTYETFKRIAEGIWEYCGDCFRGENVMRGTERVYV